MGSGRGWGEVGRRVVTVMMVVVVGMIVVAAVIVVAHNPQPLAAYQITHWPGVRPDLTIRYGYYGRGMTLQCWQQSVG